MKVEHALFFVALAYGLHIETSDTTLLVARDLLAFEQNSRSIHHVSSKPKILTKRGGLGKAVPMSKHDHNPKPAHDPMPMPRPEPDPTPKPEPDQNPSLWSRMLSKMKDTVRHIRDASRERDMWRTKVGPDGKLAGYEPIGAVYKMRLSNKLVRYSIRLGKIIIYSFALLMSVLLVFWISTTDSRKD